MPLENITTDGCGHLRHQLLDALRRCSALPRLQPDWEPPLAASLLYDCGVDSETLVNLLLECEIVLGHKIDERLFAEAASSTVEVFLTRLSSR